MTGWIEQSWMDMIGQQLARFCLCQAASEVECICKGIRAGCCQLEPPSMIISSEMRGGLARHDAAQTDHSEGFNP